MTDHVKVGVGEHGVARLRQEAEVLEAARHPGVVELLDFSDEGGVAELRTAGVDGPPLARSEPLSAEEVAGLAAAVATTAADLHDAGIVHGAIHAGHVLLGASGPVLCGFGSAGPPGPGRQPADDVAAIGRMVLDLVDGGPVAEVASSLDSCTARQAAAAFKSSMSTATLPGRSPVPVDTDPLADLLRRGRPRDPRPGPRWRRRWVLAPIALIAVTTAAVVLASPHEASAPLSVAAPRTTPSSAVTTTAGPAASLVWPPAAGPAPTFVLEGRRYSAGKPGDIALVGPFGCNGADGTAAVLRPASGQVFVFTEAASAGHEVASAQVATVLGGRGLRADDTDGDGCVDLLVERSTGDPVPVALEQGASS